jgi:hypothetical protein
MRWEDVDEGSDGVAARPHGRMVNRTRDELTKAAQSKGAFELGGIRKMESGYGLPFVGRYASFDCSDPLTPRPQLANTRIWRLFPCKMRRGVSTSLGRRGPASDLNRNVPDAAVSVFVHRGLAICVRLSSTLQPSWHADNPERHLWLAAELEGSQDASRAACMDVLSGSDEVR